MFNYDFVTFQCGVQGQVWCLIGSIPTSCLSYFFSEIQSKKQLASRVSLGYVFVFPFTVIMSANDLSFPIKVATKEFGTNCI